MGSLVYRNKLMYSFWELYSVSEVFYSTVKSVRKCGSTRVAMSGLNHYYI